MKVYDASAILAVLNGEPGAEAVLTALDEGDGCVTSVNYMEVISKLLDRRLDPLAAQQAWASLELVIYPLDQQLASAAALLRPGTRFLGLSLADRCCLALAASLEGAVVVTADRAWKALKGYRFSFIR